MLIQLAFVMGIPVGAIDDIQIVRDLDETDSGSQQASSQQAALAEFAAICLSQIACFRIQLKDLHELGTGQTQRLGDRRVTIANDARSIRSCQVFATHLVQQTFAARLARQRHIRWQGETTGA